MNTEHIFISGVTKGAGRAFLETFLTENQNAQVFGFSRTPKDTEQEILAKQPQWQGRFRISAGDASKAEDIKRLLTEATDFFKAPIDGLILNAGNFLFDESLTDDTSKKALYDLNVRGNTTLVEQTLQQKQNHPLRIVFVSSTAGLAEKRGEAFPSSNIYGKTKAEVDAYLRTLHETAEHVHVALLYPGPFGESAQKIADHPDFGDTWAIDEKLVAQMGVQLFNQLKKEKFAEGIILSEKHFSVEHGFFKKEDLEAQGIIVRFIPEAQSRYLTRTKDENTNEILKK